MSDSLPYIDQYFNGELPGAEKALFEERCISDPLFAEEVAFYVASRDGVRKELYERKRSEFAILHKELRARKSPRPGILRQIVPYASVAAACLILYIGWQVFFAPPALQKMADQYIVNRLTVLGKTMGATDSMQLGIAAFNDKQFTRAEQIFKALVSNESHTADATKYLGINYLVTGKYEQALTQFEALSRIPLEANPGLFYTAITLIKRARTGDREKARALLEEVRNRKLPGSNEAEKWLEDM